MKGSKLSAVLIFVFFMGCASVDSIREREPVFRAEAKHGVLEFRECVFDALSGVFTFIHKTSNGVTMAQSPENVVFLIEQSGGFVTAWEVPFALLRDFDMPELAAEKCNDDPDVGLFDFRK